LAEALPSAQEAVDAYRELAAANPDRHQPNLAHSLRSLALALDDLGRAVEAEGARGDTDLAEL